MTLKQYMLNLLEMFSQGINTVLVGNPNETFSSRVGSIKYGELSKAFPLPLSFWMAIIWLFDTFWEGHLEWALGPDEATDE
jgi:hypothetical protein